MAAKKKPQGKDNSVIRLMLERFKQAQGAEDKMRQKSLEDFRFYSGDQWPDYIRAMREDPLSRRPCLQINRLPQFVRQVTNEMRMNRPSIKIAPVEDGTEQVAEVIEGMIRHIQSTSNADIAYTTAGFHQVIGGFGYIRVITDYCDDESFDQEIRIERIKNPFAVYFDPMAVEPDYSDARFAFIATDIPREEYEQRYKKDATDEPFSSIGDDQKDWMGQDTVRIAEYFEIVEEEKTLYLLSDGTTTETKPEAAKEGEEELEALMGIERPTVIKERKVMRKKTMWRKVSGEAVLEETEWPGKYIPIVPVLGEDLEFDGKRFVKGMVRDAQDPQRMYNYWASAQTEAIALSPKAPFLIAEGQVEGYEKVWQNANIENYQYLPYKPTTIGGVLVPPPQRQQAEPPVQAMVQAIQMASEDLKNTTGIHDASLGARSNETSGKAILARQREGDVANFHYADNLARAINHVGRICLDLLPKIYDAPRAIRILHADEESEIVVINELFERKGEQVKFDLSVGKYDVVVETGPSYTTKRQEAAESMMAFIQAMPNAAQFIGDLVARNMDWPGSKEIAERLRKTLPPELQENDNKKQQIPPQIQMQLAQYGQIVEQLTGALNEAQDKLENKAMELESKERIALYNNQTQVVLKEMENNMGLFAAELKHINDRLTLLKADQPIDVTPGAEQAPVEPSPQMVMQG